MKPTVSVVSVKTYNPEEVLFGINKAIGLLGGIEKFITPGKKVLIKPNLLSNYKPEQAITTHPEFVRALIRILKKIDCQILVGDGPSAWAGNLSDVDSVYRTTGMFDLCKEEGVNLVRFDETFFIDDIPITHWVKECDYIISLPKFKTHDLTVLTGAVKNLFGLIPGYFKAELHRRYPHPDDFSKILIKIANNIKPVLSIVDGITALEGEGPATSGIPRNLGLILASSDVFTLDCLMARVMGLKDEDVPTIRLATGLVNNDIEVLGDSFAMKEIKEFKLASAPLTKKIPKVLIPLAQQIFYFNVYAQKYKCIFCQKCVKVCPVNAIELNANEKNIEINQKKCIQCFCCREVCPVNAIDVKKSFGFKLLELMR